MNIQDFHALRRARRAATRCRTGALLDLAQMGRKTGKSDLLRGSYSLLRGSSR